MDQLELPSAWKHTGPLRHNRNLGPFGQFGTRFQTLSTRHQIWVPLHTHTHNYESVMCVYESVNNATVESNKL